MRIGMELSNRCSVFAVVLLYLSFTHKETIILEENAV